jgi:hypothetical protein
MKADKEFRVNILHRRRDRTCMLVHGMFASAGFWLPNLDLLRPLRLLIIGLNYHSPNFNSGRTISNLQKLIGSENVSLIIAHSLGCGIAKSLNIEGRVFNICDVTLAKSHDREGFLMALADKTNLAESKRSDYLAGASQVLKLSNGLRAQNCETLTPSDDVYFEYPDQPNFIGDHFEIRDAIKKIVSEI